MVQIDIPIAAGIGAFLADAARDRIRQDEPGAVQRTYLVNLLFTVFVVCWMPLYLLLFDFGFETTHMWWHADTVLAYQWFVPIFIVLFFAANLGGVGLGVRLVRAGKDRLNRIFYLSTAAFFVGWVLVQPRRSLVLGTYRQWLAGEAVSVFKRMDVVLTLTGLATLFSIGLLLSYRALRSQPAPPNP